MLKRYYRKYIKLHQKKRQSEIKVLAKNNNLTLPQLWHLKLSHWNMFSFHHNRFSIGDSIWLLILLILFGRIFGKLSSVIFFHYMHQHMTEYFAQYDLQGTLNAITLITTELLPLLIVVWIWGNRKWLENKWILHGWSKKPFLNKHVKLTWIKPYIVDCKILCHDIWHHKKLIITASILVIIIHTLATYLFTLLSGPNISSPYAIQLGQLLHENAFLYPEIILLAPLFEEVMFRVAIPNIMYYVFNRVRKGQLIEFKYWASAILSAMGYASLHEGAESNWGTLASFVVLSLLLQWLYKHSKSLSLPIAVHSISNFVALIPNLFM